MKQQQFHPLLFLEEKEKLYMFQKKMRWLWTSFYRLVLQQDLPSKIWIVKGRGLQTEQDWYDCLDAVDTMIHQLKNKLNQASFSSVKIKSLVHDIEKNLLLFQTLIMNRIPSSQRALEEYFLDTEQQKQRQYKRRRLTKGIRF
jgi:hypothetical protein